MRTALGRRKDCLEAVTRDDLALETLLKDIKKLDNVLFGRKDPPEHTVRIALGDRGPQGWAMVVRAIFASLIAAGDLLEAGQGRRRDRSHRQGSLRVWRGP